MGRKIIKVSITVILTLALLLLMAWMLHPKGWYHKMNEFYKYQDDYDVWFLGSSYTIMGTLPEELYNEYGIRSYNLADYGQTFVIDYWMTRNLIERSKPKLVVLDVGQIGGEEKYSEDNISCVRRMISSLPFGREKIAAINDLFEGDLREEMLFPFSADHYNWEYLTKEYFKPEESYELGSDQNVFDNLGKADYLLVKPAEIPDPIPFSNTKMPESLECGYFRKLIELCRDNNIEVLLVKSPLATDVDHLRQYNQAYAIGQEYGVPYISGFDHKDSFDGDTDMWDSSHLNSFGARKWTHILGEYICEHYPQIETTTDDITVRQRWDDRYEKYLEWLDTELPLQSYLNSYLMLCTNPRYSLEIRMKEDSPVKDDGTAMKFIDHSNSSIEYVEGDESVPDISISVTCTDGVVVDKAQFFYHPEKYNPYERRQQ